MLRQRPQDSCLMRIKAVAGDLSASQLAGIVTVLKHFEYPAIKRPAVCEFRGGL